MHFCVSRGTWGAQLRVFYVSRGTWGVQLRVFYVSRGAWGAQLRVFYVLRGAWGAQLLVLLRPWRLELGLDYLIPLLPPSLSTSTFNFTS